MLNWETVDPNAILPLERYRAVRSSHEHRILYDPDRKAKHSRPWILNIRAIRKGAPKLHRFQRSYRTVDAAKRAAEQWTP
ncbi:Uncharacterised protein [Mycobacterium tuberculosis]|nr:Uncharacterised protein [Mycobacterium tuberculosis]